MSYQQKDGSGALFKNSYKKADNHPDYKGSITINGVELDLAGWVKEGKNGKFFSLRASPKRTPAERRESRGEMPDADEGIPF